MKQILITILENNCAKIIIDGEDVTNLHRGFTLRICDGEFHSIQWSDNKKDPEYNIPSIY